MMTREDWKGVTILAVCALALGGLFSLQIIFALEPTDWGTLCRTDQPLERATIVAIDKTDPFSEVQTETFRNRLLAVKDSLAQFERLAIHVLGSDDEALEGKRQKRFSLCNPGQRKDVSKYYRN